MRRAWWLVLSAGCSASVPGLSVQAVEPRDVFQQADSTVLLRGTFPVKVKVDFERPDASTREASYTAQLERGEEVIGLFDVTWLGAELLRARVPAGLAAGLWAVRVSDPFGRQARLEAAVEVVDCLVMACRLEDGGVLDAGPLPPPDAGAADGGLDAGDEEPFDAGPQPCGTFTFADDDGDGFGRPDSGALLCGSGRAGSSTDCDDLDPDTFPGAVEFCNRVDDDCDGVVDDGACRISNPGWTRRLDTGGPDKRWATVAPFGPGQVWIAGNDDVRVRADGGLFEDVRGSCPNDITVSWGASTGEAFIAGGNPALGRLTTHRVGTGGCTGTRMLSDPLVGVLGVPLADGGLAAVGVLRNTRLFDWLPPGQPAEVATNLPSSIRFEDAHARSPDGFYAVGTDTSTNQMKLYRLDGATRTWQEERLPERLALPSGRLRGVWVEREGRVFVVGDEGVVLYRRDGRWWRVPAPSSSTVTAVRAFNPARIYVTSLDGTLRKWNGRTWETLFAADAGAQFLDVEGVSEDDLWAVGTRGLVVHWPD